MRLFQHTPRALTVISMAAAVAGFWLPWARIDLREPDVIQQLRETTPLGGALDTLKQKVGRITVTVKRGAETLTGDLPGLADIPKTVSGAAIPRMVDQEQAKVAVALLELLTNTRQHVGLKRYAVYLVPGLALLGGVLVIGLGHRPPIAWGAALLCGGIAAVGFWKLLTTNTRTLFIAITIGQGLWLSLWAYVGLAVAAGLAGLAGGRPGGSLRDR
jgi:hypothetical protein